jgi:hypothetical protein
MVVEGKGSHLDFAGKIFEWLLLLLWILLELVTMLLSIPVIPFLLQILSLCFFHHGHDQPCSPPQTLDL